MDEETQFGMMAKAALDLWALPATATVTLLNYSENMTYLVQDAPHQDAPNQDILHQRQWILRLYRPHAHDIAAINSELAWMAALNKDGVVITPPILCGRNGQAVQSCDIPVRLGSGQCYLVLFGFLEGRMPKLDDDLVASFKILGELAAKLHRHAINWPLPAGFVRPSWDMQTILGARPLWGNWRDAPHAGSAFDLLTNCEAQIRAKLAQYGRASDRFGLIHADQRLANILSYQDQLRLIDFDDCGFGWFMYDFAAAISFFEDDPRIAALRKAWLDGYQRCRRLDEYDLAIIDTMVMLRRLALLAWIGSHHTTDLAREHAPDFAQRTAQLAQRYLES